MMDKQQAQHAVRLLHMAADSHPEPVELDVEAWVLGLNSGELEHLVELLCRSGHLQRVEPLLGRHAPSSVRVQLTERGLALLGRPVSEVRPPGMSERRRSGRDRRKADSQAGLPPGTIVERRRQGHDRRAGR